MFHTLWFWETARRWGVTLGRGESSSSRILTGKRHRTTWGQQPGRGAWNIYTSVSCRAAAFLMTRRISRVQFPKDWTYLEPQQQCCAALAFSILVATSLFLRDKTTGGYKRPTDNYILTYQTVRLSFLLALFRSHLIFPDFAKTHLFFHRDVFFGMRKC